MNGRAEVSLFTVCYARGESFTRYLTSTPHTVQMDAKHFYDNCGYLTETNIDEHK